MKKIVKEKPAPLITLYHPEGVSLEWKAFTVLFNDPEPLDDMKGNRRPQRRLFIFENGGKKWHVKKLSYLISPRFRDKARGLFFLKSKAFRQFKGALELRKANVGSVFPCYALEQRRGIRKEGLFITPYLKLPLLHELFLSPGKDEKRKIELFAKVLDDLRKMHKRNISHGDAHACNILVEGDKLLWCDFDMMRKCPVYLRIKGREYDLYRSLTSLTGPLINTGCWSGKVKAGIKEELDLHYPGFDNLKRRIFRRLAKKHSRF